MGLYDNFKQTNSGYISKYVGGIAPEVKEFATTLNTRYDQAADTDDALTEALGNLQHLDTDADTQYASELKKNYYKKLLERSSRTDYENLGRRTKRDALQFTKDYTPLIQRQKDMSEMVKKIQEDKDIIDPTTKAKIIGWQQDMNAAPKNEKGEFIRDTSGKIALGQIKALPYAKDVNIVEKLNNFLSKVEAKVSQGGYTSRGGLLISEKTKIRDPKVLAALGKEFLATDPEIRAMMERDLTLNTYKLTAEDYKTYADSNNKSQYAMLKAQHLTEAQIAGMAKASGMSVEDLKVSEVERYRRAAVASGKTPAEADAAFYKNSLYSQLTGSSVSLVARQLEIDERTLDAKADPNYEHALRMREAKYKSDLEKESSSIYLQGNMSESLKEIDIEGDKEKNMKNLNDKLAIVAKSRANLNGQILLALGKSGGKTPAEIAEQKAIMNDPNSVKKAIEVLKKRGDNSAAASLEDLRRNIVQQSEAVRIANDIVYNRKADKQMDGLQFTRLEDRNPSGKIAQLANMLSDNLNYGTENGKEIGSGKQISELVALEKSRNPKAIARATLTTDFSNGKPIMMVSVNGKTFYSSAESIPISQMQEILVQEVKSASKLSHTDVNKRYKTNAALAGLGASNLSEITLADIEAISPSNKPHPVGGNFSIKKYKEGASTLYSLYYGNKQVGEVYSDSKGPLKELGEHIFSKITTNIE